MCCKNVLFFEYVLWMFNMCLKEFWMIFIGRGGYGLFLVLGFVILVVFLIVKNLFFFLVSFIFLKFFCEMLLKCCSCFMIFLLFDLVVEEKVFLFGEDGFFFVFFWCIVMLFLCSVCYVFIWVVILFEFKMKSLYVIMEYCGCELISVVYLR